MGMGGNKRERNPFPPIRIHPQLFAYIRIHSMTENGWEWLRMNGNGCE
jgi:hypothetical protein